MKKIFHSRGTWLSALAVSSGLACLGQTHTPLADPLPAPGQSNKAIRLEEVASGLSVPVWGTSAPGDDDHLYVIDASGKIWVIDIDDDHIGNKRLFLDISSRLVKLGIFGGYDERGLLGMAFHPNFRRNGLFYTYSSQPVASKTDFSTMPPGVAPNCQNVLTEWRVMNVDRDRDGDGDMERRDMDRNDDEALVVDMSSARELMRIDKPQFNHNGGTLTFGPDNMLYISTGDGGNANDQGVGHVPGGNAQSLTPGNVLGKILRINPLGRNSANGQYGIPPDNPFVGMGTAPGEVWAYGFRNVYRMSFDSRSGKLLAADVGQNDIEEIDAVEKGRNYGWPIKEGTFLFSVDTAGTGFVYANSPGTPSELIDPIAEYDHKDAGVSQRIAIVGGFVYRGHDLRGLRGRYIFGDYSSAFAKPLGHVFTLDASGREVEYLDTPGLAVFGFGEDARGELYLLGNGSGIFGDGTGKVMRIARPDR